MNRIVLYSSQPKTKPLVFKGEFSKEHFFDINILKERQKAGDLLLTEICDRKRFIPGSMELIIDSIKATNAARNFKYNNEHEFRKAFKKILRKEGVKGLPWSWSLPSFLSQSWKLRLPWCRT